MIKGMDSIPVYCTLNGLRYFTTVKINLSTVKYFSHYYCNTKYSCSVPTYSSTGRVFARWNARSMTWFRFNASTSFIRFPTLNLYSFTNTLYNYCTALQVNCNTWSCTSYNTTTLNPSCKVWITIHAVQVVGLSNQELLLKLMKSTSTRSERLKCEHNSPSAIKSSLMNMY